VEVVASLSQGRTAAAQCGLFTHKSVPVIFEPPCNTTHAHCMPDNQAYKHTFLLYGCANEPKNYVIRAFYVPDGNNGRKVS